MTHAYSLFDVPQVATTHRNQGRLKAAAIHLGLSLAVAALCAVLVFYFWFPAPFGELAGGRELFVLVVTVDVVLGPLITLLIFDTKKKPWTELRRDLLVVGLLQLTALGYGLYTVAQVRPVVMALEVDRLRVLRPFDLPAKELMKAPPGLRQLPWYGITHVATRKVEAAEQFDAAMAAMGGADIGGRPDFWRPADQTQAEWAKGGHAIAKLRAAHRQHQDVIDAAIKATGKPESALKYLPILARRTDYVALIDASTGAVLGYAPLDGH